MSAILPLAPIILQLTIFTSAYTQNPPEGPGGCCLVEHATIL